MKKSFVEDRNKLARQASLLHLSALSLAEGMRNGSFKSLYRGQGIELNGVRDYIRGDDVRAIDWNVTARMSKTYVKVFEEEREMDVFLIVDQSFSMHTGFEGKSRYETAMECASLITLAACQNSNPVGAVLFDGGISFSCAPKSGQNHALYLLSKFDSLPQNQKNGSALDNALQGVQKLLKKRSLILVISDFRTEAWYEPLGQLANKHDLVCVKVTDPVDDELPDTGAIPFTDMETSYSCVLPTSSVQFRKAWREANKTRNENWKSECRRRGAWPLSIHTDRDIGEELTRFFEARVRQ